MQAAVTFGRLADYAMTFQMDDDPQSDRGFWWGDTGHSTAQGAMALTVDGDLTVANSIRVGYGESDTNTTVSYDLDVSGTGNFTGAVTTGAITAAGNILPSANATYDLGSSSNRWNVVYTSDLSLKNENGDWTIVEGEDDLFLYNNKKGKVYKFNLTEVQPSEAPPKRN